MSLLQWFHRNTRRPAVERRHSERFAVNEIVRIERAGAPVGLGCLRDVSLGGAFLETSRRSQRKGHLRLRLTSLDASVDDACWVEADVTRTHRGGVGLQWQVYGAQPVVQLLAWRSRARP